MTKDEAYIMSGMSKVLKWGNRKMMGEIFKKGSSGAAAYSKISKGLGYANILLSWLKLSRRAGVCEVKSRLKNRSR